jgi:uncharacterized protein YciI
MPEILHLLTYEYVPDVAERRTPFREGHLAAIRRYHEAGKVVIAGAVGDGPRGGLIAFRDAADIESFLSEDPYIEAGLVVRHQVEPWAIVTPLA